MAPGVVKGVLQWVPHGGATLTAEGVQEMGV